MFVNEELACEQVEESEKFAVLFSEPGRTDYDINFSLFGFPVRVHPAFFIMPLLLGSPMLGGEGNAGVQLLVLTIVFFGSILFHELGHSLAMKYYGIRSHIVLYWLGGLAVPEGSSFGTRRPYTSNAQIIVSLAGPFFNFLLGGVLIGLIYLVGGSVVYEQIGLFPMVYPRLGGTTFQGNEAAGVFFLAGLFANIVWGVLNLVPVYPLDGGQVARQVFLQADQRSGLRNSILLSMIAAILIAVLGLQSGSHFLAILFGFMAYSNYMMLQHGGGIGRGW